MLEEPFTLSKQKNNLARRSLYFKVKLFFKWMVHNHCQEQWKQLRSSVEAHFQFEHACKEAFLDNLECCVWKICKSNLSSSSYQFCDFHS